MPELSFTGLLVVTLAAFLAPLVVDLAPGPAVPSVVVELIAGIVIGPHVLGLVEVDEAIEVLSQIGLVFLFFLAGLEIAFERIRGRPLRLAAYGFLLSFALALIVGGALEAADLVSTPLFVAIVLAATAFGIVVAVLKDAGQTATETGQLIIVGASVADFATVVLLSLFFSHQGSGFESTIVLLTLFALVVVAVTLALSRARLSARLSAAVARLERTTAQIGVRGAFLLLVAFVALAADFGLEVVLGAFLAGAILRLVGGGDLLKSTHLGERLEAVGFGVFIPVFFVASGVQLDFAALFDSAEDIVLVPLLLTALLIVRGVPAFLYRGTIGNRTAISVGLLQATSLPFIVAATQIGVELDKIEPATAAALVAAGLLSVLVFPLIALRLLAGRDAERRGGVAAGVPEEEGL
jgi:Kef-type K+ transport system membrane component KefB